MLSKRIIKYKIAQMRYYVYLPLILISSFSFLQMDCKQDPCLTCPTPIEDSLNYEWVIDTLHNPFGYGVVIKSMWGVNENDIWAVGFNLAGLEEIFHYSNDKWTRVTPQLGFNYELLSIVGFSPNKIYAAGSKTVVVDSNLRSKSLILKYNGVNWIEENIEDGNSLFSIHGADENNLWASGHKGTLYHKSFGVWEKVVLDTNDNYNSVFVFKNGKSITIGESRRSDSLGFRNLYLYENSKWNLIDSTSFTFVDGYPFNVKYGGRSLWGESELDFYTMDYFNVSKYSNGLWSNVLWDKKIHNDMKAVDNNNIFTVGNHGLIQVLKNGKPRSILEYDKNLVDFLSIVPFTNTIIISAISNGKGYILRGIKK